jgi:apolipoprotein N-acyltransferase
MVLAHAAGAWRLATEARAEQASASTRRLNVLLVQTTVPSARRRNSEPGLTAALRLTDAALARRPFGSEKPDFVMWP